MPPAVNLQSSLAWSHLNTYLASIGPVYAEGLIETHFKKHPLMAMLKAVGNVKEYDDGGDQIIVRLAIGENPTLKFRSPYADPPLQKNETVTQAAFRWGTLTGAVTFFDADLKKNMRRGKLIDLVEPAIKQAFNTVDKRISWAIGQGMSDIDTSSGTAATMADTAADIVLGLRDAIAGLSSVGGSPASYGGLDPNGADTNVADWVANVYDNSANGGVPKLQKTLEHTLNLCVHGMYFPDYCVTDQAGAELYMETLLPNIRYRDLEVGDAVFSGYEFHGMPLLWDLDAVAMTSQPTTWQGAADSANTSRFYMVAPESFSWWWNPDWNMDQAIEPEWRIPENGLRRSKLITLQCQLTCEDRRSNGVLINVANN